MINKVYKLLQENEYITSQEIIKKIKMAKGSVFRIIRLMRIKGIGVLSTRKGYVLSEFAKQRDDVYFIRMMYGRRASDMIAIQAALPHIKTRWHDEVDQRNFKSMLHPLTSDLSKGMKILLTYKNNYE